MIAFRAMVNIGSKCRHDTNDPFCDIRLQTGRRDFAHRNIVPRLVAGCPVKLWRAEPAIRLGLRAAPEEAFLHDLAVADRVKPDLIEVHAFLALWRDL
jgi:hypothetical protein